MKKYIVILTFLAVAISSCTKPSAIAPYEQDTTLYRTGEVTLLCSIEDFGTKAEIDANGHGKWKNNDTILVFTNNGVPVRFAIDGTGDTKKALFKGVIPQGEVLGNMAIYPADAFGGYSNGKISVNAPTEYNKEDNSFYGVMVARIEDSFEICFQQLFAYANMTFTHFPANAVSFVLEEKGRNIAGEFIIDPDKISTSGITAGAGTTGITVHLDNTQTSFNMLLPLPVATYKNLSVTAYDENNEKIVSKAILSNDIDLARSSLKNIYCEMPKVIIDGAILLNGVYWASGNLMHDAASDASQGFREGWKLAEEQWYSVGYDLKTSTTTSGTYVYDETGSKDFRYTTALNKCDHFNFGGIKKDAGYIFDSYNQADIMNNDANFVICGKMFTDANGINETDDFEAAKYGDIAYWASNGQYRMPTEEEFAALKECDYVCGHYTEPESGLKIWGICFSEPATPGSPVHEYGDSEISAAQIENGLFLPFAGRRANSNNMVIWYRVQGVYWAGHAVSRSEISATSAATSQYSWTFYMTTSGTELKNYRADAFDRRAGFCIRPVLN